MHRKFLRVIVSGLLRLLREESGPSGKAALHDLEAESLLLVDGLGPQEGPVGTVRGLDPASVDAGLDWLFKSLLAAQGGEAWMPLAVALLRVVAEQNRDALLAGLGPIPAVPEGEV